MTDPLDLPALRAVIAGVRERLAKATPGRCSCCGRSIEGAACGFSHATLFFELDGHRAALNASAHSDLTTLASACERLAEENERMRGDLRDAHSVLVMARAFHAYSGGPLSGPFPSVVERRLSGYRTPAPAGKGEG